jgi:hypothetical protein
MVKIAKMIKAVSFQRKSPKSAATALTVKKAYSLQTNNGLSMVLKPKSLVNWAASSKL